MQLDDLNAGQLDRVRPAAFIIHATSPGGLSEGFFERGHAIEGNGFGDDQRSGDFESRMRDNEIMRKRVLGPARGSQDGPEWLKLQEMAEVEVTSEADGYPIESPFNFGAGPGWRAASPGKQRVRLVFDQPQSIKRIRLQFNEPEVARTQEFSMQWSSGASDPLKEVVRQQWTFSPHGSAIESEDYQVDLKAVSILELTIDPDIGAGQAVATLADWRLA